MTNAEKIASIPGAFIDASTEDLLKLKSTHIVSHIESRFVKALLANAADIWRAVILDIRSPLNRDALPELSEKDFQPMALAFGYFVSVEVEDVYHTYQSPFTDSVVRETLSELKNISKERTLEILGKIIGGEDAKEWLIKCEELIGVIDGESKTFQESLVRKYAAGVRFMYPDNQKIILQAPATVQMEDLALEVYKMNIVRVAASLQSS